MASSARACLTSTNSTPAQRQDALLGSLARRVIAQATGTDVPAGKRLVRGFEIEDEPRKRLWLGMLASEQELVRQTRDGVDVGSRILPPAQGFTFRTNRCLLTLDIRLACSFYVALHPTFEEQQRAVRDEADTRDLDPGNTTARSLAFAWTKIHVPEIALSIKIPDPVRKSYQLGEPEIFAAMRAAHRLPSGAEYFRPVRRRNPAGTAPRDGDLIDERTWRAYCQANLVPADDIIPPVHSARIQIDVMPQGEDLIEVLVAVVNTSPARDDQLVDGSRPYERQRLDTNLYEVVLSARTDAHIVPFELEQVAQSHRYSRSVPAFGHACPVKVDPPDESGTRLQTQFAATEPTMRVHPRRSLDGTGNDTETGTSFDSLIADPVGTTDKLVNAFEAWVESAWSTANLDRLHQEKGWSDPARAEAEKDARRARDEVQWVRAGVKLLRENAEVRSAFVAANRVMKRANSYTAWHPFQIAWILGCLPGMVDPKNNREVNIVWFATGGGKSEAYLGLMLVTLFYARYTGTTAGAQVWARFPLRLLALQQSERFAKIVLHAEVIRRSDDRIRGGEQFGIGYFVGGTNTPNKLQATTSPYYRGQDPTSPSTAEQCRILETCPLCEQRLEVRFDEREWTMWHICRNARCAMRGKLPLWTVDDDVYRHAPSVLVGTVDKLAALGFSKEFQILLGRPHSFCPRHGYRADPKWCSVFGCSEREQRVPRGFGHVRLEIADELHLLDESLGALDGMYETLLQAISERFGNPPMQIVGATATIEGYENQVAHLYKRDARRFPENGPEAGATFWSYAKPGDPLRQYMGVLPRAGTMVTATSEVAVTHALWVRDMIDRPDQVVAEAGLDPTDRRVLAEVQQAARDEYEVLVAYCLRNEDLNTFTREERVRRLLKAHNNLAVINGDTDPAEVRRAVTRLIDPPQEEADRIKIIAATKAIGHGFDVGRLGVMAVMGTPTQAAEIIQASARVGRKHPGLVVNIANSTRDRDASVFQYYAEWIRYLDRLVHKVPVNRESLPVLQRLLSGGLMAWLLQVYDRQWITGGPRRRSLRDSTAFASAVSARVIDRDMLVRDISSGFGINHDGEYHRQHRDAIDRWVRDQLTSLPLRADAKTKLPDLLHPSVPRSLRDVEEPIVVYGEL